ncbi:unnamed protein product [Ceutorhynchus assimilis]|uniref:Uncharacterized protein n=1 Tax=Ceutorhynchus assimilis TaxID=467358 RepID=A0A9N9MF97_9CUCU|nr:unnamed protein product [Ceutorhynchus assimilis]
MKNNDIGRINNGGITIAKMCPQLKRNMLWEEGSGLERLRTFFEEFKIDLVSPPPVSTDIATYSEYMLSICFWVKKI